MTFRNFNVERRQSGVAMATWDMPDRSMNVIDETVIEELTAIVETVIADPTVVGAVLTSGKSTFSAGADLTMLDRWNKVFTDAHRVHGPAITFDELRSKSGAISAMLRRLETCGKPWAAAINGLALGGGLEIALACHYRVAADNRKSILGLPEVKVGLFPGAGGTQRAPRLLGIEKGLRFVLSGDPVSVAEARTIGLVDDVCSDAVLIDQAEAWVVANGTGSGLWADRFDCSTQHTLSSEALRENPKIAGLLRFDAERNYPAIPHILACVIAGNRLPMDEGLKMESEAFARILQTNEAAAMIRSTFVNVQELSKGVRRPASVMPAKIATVGVIGSTDGAKKLTALSVQAGLTVKDGSSPAEGINFDGCSIVFSATGGDHTDAGPALASRMPSTAALAILAPSAALATVADAFGDRSRVIGVDMLGVHASPRVMEITALPMTGNESLAAAFDYARSIRHIPVVVASDAGGFTRRCALAYLLEGLSLVAEGHAPEQVELIGRNAGMALGPFAMADDLGIETLSTLLVNPHFDTSRSLEPARKLVTSMIESHGRPGRHANKGFYDYDADGERQNIWPRLGALVTRTTPASTSDEDMSRTRLLLAQVIEGVEMMSRQIIVDCREADIASIYGAGFPPYTGGVLSYVDFMGAGNFVALCRKLARDTGKRFAAPALALDFEATNGNFYQPA